MPDRNLNDEGFVWSEDGIDRKGEAVWYCVTRGFLFCAILAIVLLAYGCWEGSA
jgi:hypothetical protein